MCSISGVLRISDFGIRCAEPKAAVERMNAAQHHRGPDDRGTFEYVSDARPWGSESVTLCLGNTRLAIIDPSSSGHQPMVDPDTGICITYNGETYNFRELRRELGDEFGPWYSNTDTEVVLRAYRKWGVDAFGKLRGMFALAIWDRHKGELILARDPFGIKPLYYFQGSQKDNHAAHEFLFASEIRALLASGAVARQLSREGVASYLAYGSIQSPLTVIDQIRSLMPGECLIVKPVERKLDVRSVSIKKGIDLDVPSQQSRAETVHELRRRLEQSLSAHLVSDVPLGVFLSGGMDSSALVALMSRVSEEPPKTFSVVFDDRDFSEAPHSRLVARRFRTEHRELLLKDEHLLSLLPEAITSFDQPSMDGINTYVVSKAVKDAGITVALSGLGGDEVFAGYPSFRRLQRLQSTSEITKRFLRSVSGVGKFAVNGSIRRNKFWQLASSQGTPQDVYRITRQLFPPEAVGILTSSRFDDSNWKDVDSGSDVDPINAMSRLELQGYMSNTLLRDTDSMSMAHSLEVRVPFVDVDVVGYALAIPGSWKLNGKPQHIPKPLLADALDDLLPREFVSRRKMGFTLPFEKWMRSRLHDEISSVLSDHQPLKASGLNADAVQNVWNRFLKSPSSIGWSRPWSLYVLAKWCEVNRVAS
jgi:asparagine synthase (glutamine-hydrolysing)